MIIKNFEALAKNPIREAALRIAEAGYQSILVRNLIRAALKLEPDINVLRVQGKRLALDRFQHIFVVGFGKGSAEAVQQLEEVLTPERISDGHVIDIVSNRHLRKVHSHLGTHPLPSDQNIEATNALVKTLQKAEKDDLVIAVICGGGSSLACRPGQMTCLEMKLISKLLLMEGATIQEINVVRKHISQIHGGHLAKFAYPARVISLIISDVPGDDLETISSGPTVMDHSTARQAMDIIAKYKIPSFNCSETPKDPKYFAKVSNIMLASGQNTVKAMQIKAKELGFKTKVFNTRLHGLAREVGPTLAKLVKPGEALLASGETEVIVHHPGRGGRNQDVVLSAVPYLSKDSAIMSLASDGRDNEPIAGAIADGRLTVEKLKEMSINPMEYVNMNNSYRLLSRLADHVRIEPGTANISDFMLVVRSR
jgi:glycerate 2-kinase